MYSITKSRVGLELSLSVMRRAWTVAMKAHGWAATIGFVCQTFGGDIQPRALRRVSAVVGSTALASAEP